MILLKAVLTGIFASIIFTPIGGIVIGILSYYVYKGESNENSN